MALIDPVITFPLESATDMAVITWAGMAASDEGSRVAMATYADRCVQVSGTFGGATVTVAGSNDGETYHALSDTFGESLTLTVGALKQLIELPVFIKPRIFGGDGTTNIKVVLSGRKSIGA